MVSFVASTGIAALCGACLLALASIYTDGRRRQIPNWLPAGLVVFWAWTAWQAPENLDAAPAAALACGAGGFAAGFVMHALGWLGAGDGKLLAALALWLGPRDAGLWLLATALLGLMLVLSATVRRSSDLRGRGIPLAWAMAPPATVLLVARIVRLHGG